MERPFERTRVLVTFLPRTRFEIATLRNVPLMHGAGGVIPMPGASCSSAFSIT